MIDLWNASHEDKIELDHDPRQPDGDQARHLGTGGRCAGPESFDLIFMPDFMKAGFLTDLTSIRSGRPEPGQGGAGVPRSRQL